MLSIQKVAKELDVDKRIVSRLIHTGKLKAINISPGNKRPYWRVSEEVLEAFKNGTPQGASVNQQES